MQIWFVPISVYMDVVSSIRIVATGELANGRDARLGQGATSPYLFGDPSCNVLREDNLSRNVRIDCTSENIQSVAQFDASEVLRFRFRLESGCEARSAGFWQRAAPMHLNSHIPSEHIVTRCSKGSHPIVKLLNAVADGNAGLGPPKPYRTRRCACRSMGLSIV